jgi:hypothetical protein
VKRGQRAKINRKMRLFNGEIVLDQLIEAPRVIAVKHNQSEGARQLTLQPDKC